MVADLSPERMSAKAPPRLGHLAGHLVDFYSQTFTSPIVTGFVEENPSLHISETSVALRSVDPATTPGDSD